MSNSPQGNETQIIHTQKPALNHTSKHTLMTVCTQEITLPPCQPGNTRQQPCTAKIQGKTSHQPHGGDRYVLFSGIGELVLSAAVVGLLDPWVRPQAFDGYHVRLVKAADLLNVHLLHQHGVILEGPGDGGTAVSPR